jgi:hypothetical protein
MIPTASFFCLNSGSLRLALRVSELLFLFLGLNVLEELVRDSPDCLSDCLSWFSCEPFCRVGAMAVLDGVLQLGLPFL